MKKFLTLFFALVILGSVSFAQAPAAKAQTCSTNCYYAYTIYLKQMNGTPFTGTATIYSGGGQPAQVNKVFTNGVMNSPVYVWSGYLYSWVGSGIALDVYVGGQWVGRGLMTRRYSSPPTLPDVAIAQFWQGTSGE